MVEALKSTGERSNPTYKDTWWLGGQKDCLSSSAEKNRHQDTRTEGCTNPRITEGFLSIWLLNFILVAMGSPRRILNRGMNHQVFLLERITLLRANKGMTGDEIEAAEKR